MENCGLVKGSHSVGSRPGGGALRVGSGSSACKRAVARRLQHAGRTIQTDLFQLHPSTLRHSPILRPTSLTAELRFNCILIR